MKYGDIFIFEDKKTGDLPSESLSFKYGIAANTPLIFVKEHGDGTFMYCSLAGQHTRKSEALQYCKPTPHHPI